MPGQLARGIGVDGELDRLTRPHVAKLRFLVVRDDPDVVRHEHRQALPCARQRADRAGQLDDAAGLRRGDPRILQIEVGLIELRLRLLQLGARAFELRMKRLDAELRGGQRGLGAVSVGLLRLQVGVLLLLALHGAGAFFDQVLGASFLLLRKTSCAAA